jgi:hypothetical protein
MGGRGGQEMTRTDADTSLKRLEQVAGALLATAMAVAFLTSCQPARSVSAAPPAETAQAKPSARG